MTAGEELLRRLLSSDTKADLLALFHQSPDLEDNLEGLAGRIGQTSMAIQIDVEDLLDLGVLKKKPLGESEVIVLDSARDNEIQRMIAHHFKRHGSN